LLTKFETQAINAVDQIIAVQKHKNPLAAKVAGAAFLAILFPIYLNTYGITNFSWFCDAALILTMVVTPIHISLVFKSN
jgi:hypothetical protein